jgi:hypothetical protein
VAFFGFLGFFLGGVFFGSAGGFFGGGFFLAISESPSKNMW